MALFWNVFETTMLCTQLYSLFGDHLLKAGNSHHRHKFFMYLIKITLGTYQTRGGPQDIPQNHLISSEAYLGSYYDEEEDFRKKIFDVLSSVWNASKCECLG